MLDAAHPTEVPQGAWDMAVFKTAFPRWAAPERHTLADRAHNAGHRAL